MTFRKTSGLETKKNKKISYR